MTGISAQGYGTPGPWHIRKSRFYDAGDDGGLGIVADVDGAPLVIAEVFTDARLSEADFLRNARLIAAAPALLQYTESRAEAGDADAHAVIAAMVTGYAPG